MEGVNETDFNHRGMATNVSVFLKLNPSHRKCEERP